MRTCLLSAVTGTEARQVQGKWGPQPSKAGGDAGPCRRLTPGTYAFPRSQASRRRPGGERQQPPHLCQRPGAESPPEAVTRTPPCTSQTGGPQPPPVRLALAQLLTEMWSDLTTHHSPSQLTDSRSAGPGAALPAPVTSIQREASQPARHSRPGLRSGRGGSHSGDTKAMPLDPERRDIGTATCFWVED